MQCSCCVCSNRHPRWAEDDDIQHQIGCDVNSLALQATRDIAATDWLMSDQRHSIPMTTETISGYQLRYPVVKPTARKDCTSDAVTDVECCRRDGNVGGGAAEMCAVVGNVGRGRLSARMLNYCHVLYDSSVIIWRSTTVPQDSIHVSATKQAWQYARHHNSLATSFTWIVRVAVTPSRLKRPSFALTRRDHAFRRSALQATLSCGPEMAFVRLVAQKNTYKKNGNQCCCVIEYMHRVCTATLEIVPCDRMFVCRTTRRSSWVVGCEHATNRRFIGADDDNKWKWSPVKKQKAVKRETLFQIDVRRQEWQRQRHGVGVTLFIYTSVGNCLLGPV